MRAAPALQVMMIVIGVALIARAIAAGGAVLAIGVVVGVLFVAAGAARLWAERGT